MKKPINYKSIAEDLIAILQYDYDDYRICYELGALGVDDDDLRELGFDSDDIHEALTDNMHGNDPRGE
jgi:hypothetical protein